MYLIKKRLELSASHELNLPYASKCRRMHGHNWIITVHVKAEGLNEEGMVVDFSIINAVVMKMDHDNINNFIPQPTAENMAKYICDEVNALLSEHAENLRRGAACYRVEVQETEGNVAEYEDVSRD